MKKYLAHIILQIYIWGMILIPSLHHAGCICPHSNAPIKQISETTSQAVPFFSMHGLFSSNTEICLICALGNSLIDSPELDSFALRDCAFYFCHRIESGFYVSGVALLKHSRAPPACFC